MRKLLSPESEVTIPVPPPVVERPKPPQEAPKTVAPGTREAETGQEISSGEKNAAGGPAAGEARAAFRLP